MKKTTFSFILSSLILIAVFTPRVLAQTSVSLAAIPPRLEISAQPGETIQETIKVRNDSETELVVKTEVEDFIVKDDQGTPVPVKQEVSGRWSLASWVYLSPKQTILKPKTTQVISLVITVPADALPGGHYAMIVHSPLNEANLGGSGATIAQKVGTLIYLDVAGKINEDTNLLKFEAVPPLAEYGPIKLITQIQNLSDVHIKPIGQITISNLFSQKSASLPLEQVNIFPFQSRTYENEFSGKWHFGRYKAELEAAYGKSGQVVTGLIYFWIIPWKIITAAVLGLIIIIVLILIIAKKNKKNQPTKKKKQKKK